MTRVRTDNCFGTVTDAPLTAGATTMNSAGLANLAVVSSAEAIIVLDPNRVSGAPEIVVVTAHTGSATSATIVRGQFGTSAREHAAGTEWVHGPIASNASSFVTAADDQGDFVPMNAWEAYTPTFANTTVGSGTVTGRFQRIGRLIRFKAKFVLGSGSAVSGSVTVSLPVTATANDSGPMGNALLHDATGSLHPGVLQQASTTTVNVFTQNASGTYLIANVLSATVPFTWATSDFIAVEGAYEAAS